MHRSVPMSNTVYDTIERITVKFGRAAAQTGTRRPRFETRSDHVAGFLRVLRFPLPIVIPPTAPHSSSIIRGWCNSPVSGRRTKWTQVSPHPKKLLKLVTQLQTSVKCNHV
jgi:hypothetical protein